MAAPPPRRPPPIGFQPRFTLLILYLALFFFLFAMALVAPPLIDMYRGLPPGPIPEATMREAGELARATVRPRMPVALFGAVLTTAAGTWFGLLPGMKPRS